MTTSSETAPEFFGVTRTDSTYIAGRTSSQTGCQSPAFSMYQFCLPRGSCSYGMSGKRGVPPGGVGGGSTTRTSRSFGPGFACSVTSRVNGV